MTAATKFIKNTHPFPTYFFSHGAPSFMYPEDQFGNAGAYKTIKKIGTKIKSQLKPDYIIVVSAHWQSQGTNLIEINYQPRGENKLIYDFYGFPKYMYQEEFHSFGSLTIANEIQKELKSGGFDTRISDRGIDHGVWVPFKVAFSDYTTQTKQPEEKGALDLPDTAVIQVSLTSSDGDFEKHFKLGEVLSKFRNELVWDEEKQRYLSGMIICSGMSVHNLYDLGTSFQMPGKVMPYVKPFNQLLNNTLTKSGDRLLNGLLDLKKSSLLKQAHPTLEHFVPIVVASGVANKSGESIKELYNAEANSLAWGIYQIGNYKL
ncbi:uncharacterized protein J8A68_001471 [[Candida] subhashii]|uniref:Extradiol ring-cleavage dioxygenase class III enzyme subunit B domain-containing protein n=1 Tax=[Candida] subhashii TaxID=561895 RepID=A0A8J5QQT9_9ASCO|nr:uncharacterized protein J8A68_001471 [[Candida] subhashii]KAG7665006.1 hypothetical protein J8A68_001471 [[Candida] subhashii]